MFAAVGSTTYNIFLVLHVLTVLVAFAPAFVHPILANQAKSMDDGARRQILSHMVGNGRRIYAPALIVTGILGFGLSGMSEDVYALTQGWLIASIILWIAMNGILHAVLIPAERTLAGGDDSAQSRLDIAGAAMAIMLVVVLILMVFKPG